MNCNCKKEYLEKYQVLTNSLVRTVKSRNDAYWIFWSRVAEVINLSDMPVESKKECFKMLMQGFGTDGYLYLWFSKNYGKFLYIDRIVIDAPYRRLGVGKELYREVFRHAAETGVPFVTAEIDTEPYNEVSLGFHRAMGFREVGVQSVRNNSIRVSLQEAEAYAEK